MGTRPARTYNKARLYRYVLLPLDLVATVFVLTNPRRTAVTLVLTTLTSVAATALWQSEAHACQACACGDATFAVRPTDSSAHTLTVAAQTASRGEAYGTDYLWDFHEWRLDLTLGWSHERTTVALRLPWVWRNLSYDGMRTAKTSGLGDIEIAGSYVFTKRATSADPTLNMVASARGSFAAIHGGLTMPSAKEVLDAYGEPLMDDVQSGTGSFTPFVGLNWGTKLGGFRLDGRHTAYLPLPGRFGFQVGPTVQQRVRLMAEPFDQFRFGVAAYALWAAPVKMGGEIEEDTGGFVGYLDLEAEVAAHAQFSVVGGARLPVIQALRGDHRAEPGVYVGLRFQQPIKPKTRVAEPEAPLYL